MIWKISKGRSFVAISNVLILKFCVQIYNETVADARGFFRVEIKKSSNITCTSWLDRFLKQVLIENFYNNIGKVIKNFIDWFDLLQVHLFIKIRNVRYINPKWCIFQYDQD